MLNEMFTITKAVFGNSVFYLLCVSQLGVIHVNIRVMSKTMSQKWLNLASVHIKTFSL